MTAVPPPPAAPAPPGPPRAAPPPGPAPASAHAAGWASPPRQRRPWRERLPELVAAIGGVLVVLAVTGFLASSWDTITQAEKAMALGVAAAVLTAGGMWADRSQRLERVIEIGWATATLLVVGAVDLAGSQVAADSPRAVLAAAGAAGALHAAVLLGRRPSALLGQLALFGSLLYAVGPPADYARWDGVGVGRLLAEPLVGLVDIGHWSDAFVLTGVGYLVIGTGWVALSRLLPHRAAVLARALAVPTLLSAALQLNLVGPVGAVVALAVVLGLLVHGLVADEGVTMAAGVTGCVVAGLRVLAALFSGTALVTVLVFGLGLAMLAWAFTAMRRRQGTTG